MGANDNRIDRMAAETAKTPRRACSECGKVFPLVPTKGGAPQRYCSPEHKRAWENRQLSRGQGLVILAQAWQEARHRKSAKGFRGWVLNEMCAVINRYSAEDKAAGRLPALDILKDRQRADGTLQGGMK